MIKDNQRKVFVSRPEDTVIRSIMRARNVNLLSD
jgi:hypothetical protein